MGHTFGNSLEERLAKYRQMVAAADAAAEETKTPEARNAYIAMASAWRTLIQQLLRQIEQRDEDAPFAPATAKSTLLGDRYHFEHSSKRG